MTANERLTRSIEIPQNRERAGAERRLPASKVGAGVEIVIGSHDKSGIACQCGVIVA